MSFSEKANLKDERRPLLRDPVWHYNHRYGRGRGYDSEEVDEMLGRDAARTQRFQWMLFLGVTCLSILILLATMGLLIKLSQTHPSVGPISPTTTTSPPFSKLPVSTPSTGPPLTTTTIVTTSSSNLTSGIHTNISTSSPIVNG